MSTVAAISAEAFNAVSAEVTDAIHAVTLSYSTQGAYIASAGAYGTTTSTVTGARGVLDVSKPIGDIFPNYVAGPSEKLILIEGATATPKEGWGINFNSVDYVVKRVLDIMDAGTLFYVVAI